MHLPIMTFIVLMSLAGLAHADDIPVVEQKTLESYADANKTCQEWTDSCAVCLRHADGTFACSLPGIACQPQALVCRTEAAPAK